MIKIESGIPIPDGGKGMSGKAFKIIKDMKAGDSILFRDRNHSRNFTRVAKALRWKVVCRSVDGGLRMWRIK